MEPQTQEMTGCVTFSIRTTLGRHKRSPRKKRPHDHWCQVFFSKPPQRHYRKRQKEALDTWRPPHYGTLFYHGNVSDTNVVDNLLPRLDHVKKRQTTT